MKRWLQRSFTEMAIRYVDVHKIMTSLSACWYVHEWALCVCTDLGAPKRTACQSSHTCSNLLFDPGSKWVSWNGLYAQCDILLVCITLVVVTHRFLGWGPAARLYIFSGITYNMLHVCSGTLEAKPACVHVLSGAHSLCRLTRTTGCHCAHCPSSHPSYIAPGTVASWPCIVYWYSCSALVAVRKDTGLAVRKEENM